MWPQSAHQADGRGVCTLSARSLINQLLRGREGNAGAFPASRRTLVGLATTADLHLDFHNLASLLAYCIFLIIKSIVNYSSKHGC